MNEYWGNTDSNTRISESGYSLELRANIALSLIEKWGTVAGNVTREDSQGRAVCDLIAEDKLVARCFTIADLFVAEAERRGAIREDTRTSEEIAVRSGELARLRTRAEWKTAEAAFKAAGLTPPKSE